MGHFRAGNADIHMVPSVRMIRIPPVSERRSPLLSKASRFGGFVGSRTITERNQY